MGCPPPPAEARYGTVVAPGKLVLLGEYAVVDGGAALVAAVDRGVRCVVTPGRGWSTPGGDDRFVRAALAGAPEAHYAFTDDRPVLGLSGKPGFGGSAAATVAACVAAGRTLEDALAIHHAVQGGGSGLDVRASWWGGVRTASGEAVRCPPFVAVWSGASAATGPRVATWRAWPEPLRAAFRARSDAAVAAFATAPFAAVREAYANLRAMAAAAGVDYDRPVFAAIDALAARFGGAAKPSGAGGGDVAVALFPDEEARAAFVAAAAGEGLVPIAVEPAPAAAYRAD